MRRRPLFTLAVLALFAACGGGSSSAEGADAADDGTSEAATESRTASSDDRSTAGDTSPSEASPSPTSSAEARSDEPLCDVIEDDEALMPAGAQTIGSPGVQEANYERRCIFDLGVDMPIDAVRDVYRSTLSDLGYEITRVVEHDEGITRGHLSRMFMRAMKPGLQVNVQLDEFDPSQTPIADYRVQGKVQIDAMRR